ncbi:MAG: hypothetical protein KDA78_10530 [Planctomycetaceae bacterium]|nr:hypothetical protein [Planctomycetaceae bacterium]
MANQSEQKPDPEKAVSEFQQAAESEEIGLFAEFWYFIRDNKAWWMIPILLTFAAIGLLIWFSATPLAPFIYPLF